jgi:solute:Na+ symporter, SSS family
VFSFGSDLDESFWGAGAAFVVDAIVTVVVTAFTTPKPVSELRGLVWGMAIKDPDAAKAVHRWWESPALLGGTAVAIGLGLTVVFF